VPLPFPLLAFCTPVQGNGNVTASDGKTFAYDSQNHMVSTSASGTSVSMVYDGDGNRVAKTVNGVTASYLIDDLNPTGYAQVVEELQAGAVTRQYTYGLQRISQNQPISNVWTISFYGYDGGGSVRNLTSTTGAVTDTYEYDAYGNSFATGAQTPNNYLYRGEQFDSDLGLYYLRARYYNPNTGRFLSRDPGDGEISDPATLHKYVYANGDPIDGADPSGWASSESYARVNFTISVAPIVIRALQATAVAIACADVWIGTKTHAEVVAGPFGTVTMVAPCVWLGSKPSAPPAPPPPLPFPIPGTPPSPWPPRCPALKAAKEAACDLADSIGGCTKDMSPSQLGSTYAAWVACGAARAQYHKVCWNGGNEGHQKAEAQVWEVVRKCTKLLSEQ
jgi:RHS repeat-associated protein